MTGRAAYILGYPIAHSISPAIHNAAFESRGLDVRYAPREVAPADLPGAVRDLRRAEVLGANITVPYKEAVLDLVDEVEPIARAIGAANTIINRDGRLRATNTDAAGFSRSLAELGVALERESVLLLGAGGSARAVGQALLASGAPNLVIANRHPDRARALALHLWAQFPGVAIGSLALATLGPVDVASSTLIVNTTTVGLRADETPLPAALLPAAGGVVDIIYNPPQTRLLREAAQLGLWTSNGLAMLVHQAAEAWQIWTGQPAPLEVMWAAARAALDQVAAAD